MVFCACVASLLHSCFCLCWVFEVTLVQRCAAGVGRGVPDVSSPSAAAVTAVESAAAATATSAISAAAIV